MMRILSCVIAFCLGVGWNAVAMDDPSLRQPGEYKLFQDTKSNIYISTVQGFKRLHPDEFELREEEICLLISPRLCVCFNLIPICSEADLNKNLITEKAEIRMLFNCNLGLFEYTSIDIESDYMAEALLQVGLKKDIMWLSLTVDSSDALDLLTGALKRHGNKDAALEKLMIKSKNPCTYNSVERLANALAVCSFPKQLYLALPHSLDDGAAFRIGHILKLSESLEHIILDSPVSFVVFCALCEDFREKEKFELSTKMENLYHTEYFNLNYGEFYEIKSWNLLEARVVRKPHSDAGIKRDNSNRNANNNFFSGLYRKNKTR